ncbi:MAG: hypothetical protein D6813_13370 [Calditrichaeota bacterium]|nr:MAG: hypothetical protein D6813_13370 [Calditrichota bacterium]
MKTLKRPTPLAIRSFIISFTALISGYLILLSFALRWGNGQLNVRINTSSSRDTLRLKKFNLKIKKQKNNRYVDASISQKQYFELKKAGFNVSLISAPRTAEPSIPRVYRPMDEIESELFNYQLHYPDIVKVEQIGESTTLGLPIWAVKISDHVQKKEDEPRILFTGVHHAREPIGANICLNIIKNLCENYGADSDFTRWVDELEIWFIPLVNPDGYQYILENNLRFPWWRKNLRDNNHDGIFDPLVDGVDLNRNYDYNWDQGGDGKPSSWFYRGSRPFSEKETQAIRDLAMRENFVFGISYHSYGESILFPWGNYYQPPDIELIVDIASEMASRIHRVSGRGGYSVLPLNGRVGQSSIWMYGKLRVLDYIVEVGTQYFPAEENVPFILQENLKGATYLFDRALQAGIRGQVYDAVTRKPLLAEIRVQGYTARYVENRHTDPETGGFYQILNPGSYNIEFRSKGYKSKLVKHVKIERGKSVRLDIPLFKKFYYHNTN